MSENRHNIAFCILKAITDTNALNRQGGSWWWWCGQLCPCLEYVLEWRVGVTKIKQLTRD